LTKLDCIKFKSFCTTQKKIIRIKRQPTEWEKIFTCYSLDKGLVSKIYKDLQKLNTHRTNNPINKCANELGQIAKEVQMAKKCSMSLAITKMKVKTTLRFHLAPVRMAIIQKTNNNKCWQRCREKGTLIYCWLECKLVQSLWKTVWKFLNN
jgi:hypothetical protein